MLNGKAMMTRFAGVLLLLLVLLGIFFPGRNVLALSGMNRFQLDNEEGALLYQTLRLAQGKSLYVAPHDMDCVPNVYPPGYFLACAPFVSVGSPDLFTGRVVSFGSLIAILLILMLSGLSAVGRIRPGPDFFCFCVAPLLIIFTYEFARWSNYYRVDMFALALSFGGFALLVTSRGCPSRKRMAAALALLLCGFFTKQTMLAAPLAGTLWLAIVHGKRIGFAFGAVFSGCVALIFGGLCAWTGGDFFRLTVLSNTNTFVFADLFVWARHLWLFYKFWIVSAVAVAVGCALLIRGRGLTPWVLYLLCSLPGLAAIGKLGSAENYLLEPLLALSMFTVTAVAALMFVGGGRGCICAFVSGILLIAHFGYRGYQEFAMGLRPVVFPDRQGMAAWNSVANQVRVENRQGRKTWCEPALMNVMAGAPVYYQPFIMSELIRQGKYHGQEFTQAIVRKEFAMVVTMCDMEKSPDTIVYLPETVAAMRENYVLREQYGDRFSLGALRRLYVYRPR